MCGIFAVIGDPKHQQFNAADTIIQGLKRLDYRGYDSWGVTIASGHRLHTVKQVGKIGDIDNLKDLPKSLVGIGHTRWATHGAITRANAHPHYASDKSFALAQNGILENYLVLKAKLKKQGFKFNTQTDTEVIVRLIEWQRRSHPILTEAVRTAFQKLAGRNTIILVTSDGQVIAARNGSPLVIGLNHDQTILSSDTLSFTKLARKMIAIDNGQLVHCQGGQVKIYSLTSGKIIKPQIESIAFKGHQVDKEGFPHFMLKEIHDTPYAIRQVCLTQDLKYQRLAQAIRKAGQVYIIGSGTTGLAAAQIAYYLRTQAHINAISLIGAEAQSYFDLFGKHDLILAPSQSGETADVLEVLEIAKAKGVKIASFVNMPGSMMTRMSHYPFMANAGPEMCVMSTKIFVAQIAWGYLVAQATAGKLTLGKSKLEATAKAIDNYLDNKSNHRSIKFLARKLATARDIFLLGKSQNLQIVMEGMVKIIEGTYKHAHAIPAGDLKHYAITIIEKGVPVVVVLSNDTAQTDVLSAASQVKARGATVIGIAPRRHPQFDEFLPVPDLGETSALMNIIPLQLLAYYLTVMLGHNVDKPRNIAKSVTVK